MLTRESDIQDTEAAGVVPTENSKEEDSNSILKSFT
jgi:hypothetical protein